MSGIGSSLSGIKAGLERQRVAASNIAGAVAQDHVAKRIDVVPGVMDGVETRVRDDSRDRVDISEQAVELIQAEQDVAVNVHVLKRLDEIQAALMDMTG